MRVVSWNVRSLRDGRSGVARVLRSLDPDVVLLQEAPRLAGWRVSRLLLARQAGLRVATHGRAAGTLVLVRPALAVSSSYDVALPRRPGLHRRAVTAAVVELAGLRVTVASTHLDLEPAARLGSATAVRAALPAGPLVLGADVNAGPGEPAWEILARGLVDARAGQPPTFPAWAPERAIDGLFVSPELAVGSCATVDAAGASDHRPLVAEIGAAQPGGGSGASA